MRSPGAQASLYVINPRAPAASYFGAEVFARSGFPAAQGIADLAAVTVAAMAPPHWDVSVCDEHISPVDFDHPARCVAITGKVTQARRMLALAAEFRRRGKTVLIGGPCASLSPDVFRGSCDVLVVGGHLQRFRAGCPARSSRRAAGREKCSQRSLKESRVRASSSTHCRRMGYAAIR